MTGWVCIRPGGTTRWRPPGGIRWDTVLATWLVSPDKRGAEAAGPLTRGGFSFPWQAQPARNRETRFFAWPGLTFPEPADMPPDRTHDAWRGELSLASGKSATSHIRRRIIRRKLMSPIDLSPGMPGGIGAVPLRDAVTRVVSFCTHPKSGWHTYDRLGEVARRRGHFDEIAPWSLLWAAMLAGRISVSDVAGFTYELRTELVQRLQAVSARDLASMDGGEVEILTFLCRFGFPGVWAPKITKMLALYRPDAVPVLDGHVAMAVGFDRDGFSSGREPRWGRIQRTLLSRRSIFHHQQTELDQIRREVALAVPDIRDATDLRLLDIIIWTSQDDRLPRPGSPANYWLNRPPQGYRPDPPDPEPLR
jgi:hypothetical protein